ncbi:hypothetical protein OHB49_44385 (plasmid) [Streptomyces sp. NBC_01717]|uniref:hypothetical protein n=1 Tax=Streptomyces sp. NBC_01717 TaxID=2975918 RepID=UPI002E3077B0|nr:hypothetical protein [Streptomyces sp. NBC_01717]
MSWATWERAPTSSATRTSSTACCTFTPKDRVTERIAIIEELTEFKKLVLSRLAAQHDEITHLRSPQPSPEPPSPAKLATVPRVRTTVIGTCS